MPGAKEYFDRAYTEHEKIFDGKPHANVETIVTLLPPHSSVLDLGAGNGRDAVYLAEHGAEVTAIDISSVGLELLRKKAAERGVNIKIIESNLRDFDFKDKSYDAIVCNFALHMFLRPFGPALVKKVQDHTKPGGLNAVGVLMKEGDFYPKVLNKDRFFLDPNELKELYKDWEILYYEEKTLNLTLATNADGSPGKNKEAIIAARKIK